MPLVVTSMVPLPLVLLILDWTNSIYVVADPSVILNYVRKFVSCFLIFHNFIEHIFALFSSETYILLLLRLLRNLGAYLSV